MARTGRYRNVRVALWGEPDFQRLSSDARLLHQALTTGSQSNIAGLFFYYHQQLERETGLDHAAIEAAFAELEKIPSAARSFVVRDHRVCWVRDQLRNDPALDKVPDTFNDLHRRGIRAILGSLPHDSAAVRKFRASYKLLLQTPSQGDSQGVSQGVSDSGTGDPKQKTEPESGTRRAREEAPLASRAGGALAAPSSNGSKHTPSREEIEAERRRATEALRTTGCSRIVAEQLERMTWPSRLTYFEHHGSWPTEPITTPTDEARP